LACYTTLRFMRLSRPSKADSAAAQWRTRLMGLISPPHCLVRRVPQGAAAQLQRCERSCASPYYCRLGHDPARNPF
jgi:hypothetical protein